VAIREDSGGAGRYRGGCGTIYDYEFVGATAAVSILADRSKSPPFGIAGGHAGARMELLLALDGEREPEVFPAADCDDVKLVYGSRVILRMPGGGGYGDPRDRDPGALDLDVRRGYVSKASRETLYTHTENPASPALQR
jgi:N-methylhydantoinase B